MAFHDDLLEQAFDLVGRDANQANLRRAVSAAYYAVFHLLITEAVDALAREHSHALRARMRRAFAHADMVSVCRQFASGGLPDYVRALLAEPIEPDLTFISKMFVFLQEARLIADYDMAMDFSLGNARLAVLRAHGIFTSWSSIRHTPNATTLLTARLLGRHWNR